HPNFTFLLLIYPPHPQPTLFPYTTLFRSHVPSPAALPTNSLCEMLSSGEVVSEIASCGLSKPCCGMVGPTQRTARKFDSRLSSEDRKSTRLNSSHVSISYAVFCLKKKKK